MIGWLVFPQLYLNASTGKLLSAWWCLSIPALTSRQGCPMQLLATCLRRSSSELARLEEEEPLAASSRGTVEGWAEAGVAWQCWPVWSRGGWWCGWNSRSNVALILLHRSSMRAKIPVLLWVERNKIISIHIPLVPFFVVAFSGKWYSKQLRYHNPLFIN